MSDSTYQRMLDQHFNEVEDKRERIKRLRDENKRLRDENKRLREALEKCLTQLELLTNGPGQVYDEWIAIMLAHKALEGEK